MNGYHSGCILIFWAVPLLVCGGDDSKLHLFTPSDDGKVL